MNARIRNRGYAAWGILHQRDHFNENQLDFNDTWLWTLQIMPRIDNQKTSEKFRVKGGPPADVAPATVGLLVWK